MLENLKTTKFRNGESIPNVTDNAAWAGLTSAAWCDYDNSASNGNILAIFTTGMLLLTVEILRPPAGMFQH